MLRTVLVFLVLSARAQPALALENAYDRNLSEYMYNQCLEQATADRKNSQPPLSREEIRSAAAKECEAKQPPSLKIINGQTVKDRYNQCLYDALDHRSAFIPPQPFREIILQTFEDCKGLERLYLGLKPDDTTQTATEVITTHRSERAVEEEKAKEAYYTPNIGFSVALLLEIKVGCQKVSKNRIDQYVKPMLKIISKYLSAPEDKVFEMETISNPMMEIYFEIEKKGQQAWCTEARQKLKTSGVNDVFLK